MIGDADVAPAALARRSRHLGYRRLAVRPGGVTVDGATDVGQLEQRRDRAGGRALDLAMRLAHLGGYGGQPGERVELRFIGHGDHVTIGITERVALEDEAARRESLAHRA